MSLFTYPSFLSLSHVSFDDVSDTICPVDVMFLANCGFQITGKIPY